jgi:hypothetical protein
VPFEGRRRGVVHQGVGELQQITDTFCGAEGAGIVVLGYHEILATAIIAEAENAVANLPLSSRQALQPGNTEIFQAAVRSSL